MKDARPITKWKIWDTFSPAEKRKMTSSATPINPNGTRASKEQVQQRRWSK